MSLGRSLQARSGSSWWRSDEIWQTDESSITPQHLSRFGIEVDEALRVGGSGFLGESDAGEADLSGFFKEFHGTFSGDEDVGGLAFGMDPVLLVLCGGNSEVVGITASTAGHPERSLHFVARNLKQTHELLIHLKKPARSDRKSH